jgi:predicted 3-demethylubiquinone-9 3-methyltransferase (glyoxalase superfamily)
MLSIYPCIWFDQQAQQAASFYEEVFPDAERLSENPMVVLISIRGTKLMLLNGGPMYQANAAISYFVYCGSDEEIERVYAAFTAKGSIMMPLGTYPWTRRYAWVIDQFGVSWQLDVEPIRAAQKIVPALLFSQPQGHVVAEAVRNYTRIFEPSMILMEAPHPPQADMLEGALLFAQFKLHDYIFNAMSSTERHEFQFGPGNSFVVECDTQEQIDHFWSELGSGGQYQMCGWLVDRYGVSWQIIPSILPTLMADPLKRDKVVEAFMKMQKFEIAGLVDA